MTNTQKPRMNAANKRHWTNRLLPLRGCKIVKVRYLDASEMHELGWDQAAVVLELDDGTLLYPSADDEGNGAGALFIQPSRMLWQAGVPEVAPVI